MAYILWLTLLTWLSIQYLCSVHAWHVSQHSLGHLLITWVIVCWNSKTVEYISKILHYYSHKLLMIHNTMHSYICISCAVRAVINTIDP